MSENTAENSNDALIQKESASFDCLAVTNVQIFAFKEGISVFSEMTIHRNEGMLTGIFSVFK